jgi:serine/threonine protein kinase
MCITHCDLKPENILITDPGSVVRAKILDYGIARVRAAARQAVGQVTSSETAPFTPGYGAPEQWVPKRYGQTGPWTDVWGLALTMVECVTGRPPIEGERVAMMGTVLDDVRRPSPQREGAEVNDEVEAVFIKALAVDPRRRYQDIETFWTELEQAQGLASSFERMRKRSQDYSLPPASDRSGSYPISDEGQDEGEGAAIAGVTSGGVTNGGVTSGGVGSELVLPTEGDGAGVSEAPSFDLAMSQPPKKQAADDDRASQSGTYAASSKSGAFPAYRPGGRQPRLGMQRAEPVAHASVSERLRGPIVLGVLAIVVTAVDMVVADGALSLGPLRLRWLAGVMAVLALGWALVSMVGDKDDE